MKKMLITLFAVLAIGASLNAAGCGGGCCPDYNGCCAGERQVCRAVFGVGATKQARTRYQCDGDCDCACNQTAQSVVRVA